MPSYEKSKGRRDKSPPFVKLINIIFDSDAFKDLTSSSRDVLFELIRRHNGLNNGYISLSCREVAIKYKIGKGTASKCFKQLQLHGFIEPVKLGAFTIRHATEWRLTFEPTQRNCGTPKPSTNEWKRYKPSIKKVPDAELKVSPLEP